MLAGEIGGLDPRPFAEQRNLETGVIGQRWQAARGDRRACLFSCVLQVRGRILDHLEANAQVLWAQELERKVAENGPQLGELAGIGGSE
jgi:hypothetical protein